MKTERHDHGEGYARACIAHELAARVSKHDDNSKPGMYDAKVLYADGTVRAVEVTTCTNGKDQALWNATAGAKDWVEPRLKLGWIVRFSRGCRLGRKWKQRLVALLVALEASQIRSVVVPDLYAFDYDIDDPEAGLSIPDTFIQELRSIGAYELAGDDSLESGRIIPWPNLASAGWVPKNADPVLDWLEPWLTDPKRKDNLEKLARSGHPHRHLFVGIPGFADCPESILMAMSDSATALPTRPPKLPNEVTEIWLVGGWSDGPGLRWSQATGWKYFDKLIQKGPPGK